MASALERAATTVAACLVDAPVEPTFSMADVNGWTEEKAYEIVRAVLMAVLSDMQRYEPDGDGYGWFGMSKDDSGDYIDISGILEELKDTTND